MKVTRRARIYQNLTLKSDVAQRKCICPILLSHNTIHAYQTTSPWIPGFWVAAEPFIRVCNELVADWVYLRSPWPITKSVRGSSANKAMKLEVMQRSFVRLRGTMGPIISAGSDDSPLCRNGSGQGHSIVKFPVRKEGGWSARLLIYTKTLI